jgi:dTDP-4-dehydrorhamnose reductase
VYGASKLAGEGHALGAAANNLVIRTCGLYGVWAAGGRAATLLRRCCGGRQGKPLRVVNDQRCTPSYTADVADASVQLIARGAGGLFHVTNAGDCTWYEFAAEIFRRAGLTPDLTPTTSAEFGAVAQRPAYSVLSGAKLAAAGVSAPRPWPEALAAYLQERQHKPG